MGTETHIPRFTSMEILQSLKEHTKFSFLFNGDLYSFYINEIKGADLLSLIQEYPDLMNISPEQLESGKYSVFSVNFISNSIKSNGTFHKIRIYIDCNGQILQTLDSAKK